MAKVSLGIVKRPGKVTFTKTFTDPANPDLSIPVTLRKLGAMEWVAAHDLACEKAEQYVTGFNGSEPQSLPPIDGQPVFVSESACRVAAAVAYAQVADDQDRYTVEELLGFMTVDAICAQMTEAFNDLQRIPESSGEGDSQSPLA